MPDFAVDMFFVVSGYLIFASFDKRPAIGDFYIRRVFRIYPLYMAVVLQGWRWRRWRAALSWNMGELLRYLGLNLIMANFLAHDIGGLLSGLPNPGINPSLWTLKIEMGFYLMMPLLWYLIQRFGLAFLALLYAASTALRSDNAALWNGYAGQAAARPNAVFCPRHGAVPLPR